jgi:hypothetical protein
MAAEIADADHLARRGYGGAGIPAIGAIDDQPLAVHAAAGVRIEQDLQQRNARAVLAELDVEHGRRSF